MKRIFWVVSSILLTFLTCEIIARALLWMPTLEINVGTPRQGLTVDAIGDWVPNQRAIWEDGRLEYPYFVNINNAGFRNLEGINPDAYRILALGDSQTFGLFLNSHDIWTNVTEKILNVRSKRSVQLLNNGIPGSTISDHLAYLQQKGHLVSADMVLLVVNPNDITDLRREKTTFGSLRSTWMKSRDNVFLQEARWFFRHNSGLYVAARKIKEFLTVWWHGRELRQFGLSHPNKKKQVMRSRMVGSTANERAIYKKMLIEAVGKVRSLGGRAVLVFLSAYWEGDKSEIRRILNEVSRRDRVPLIDLEPAFREATQDQATWYRDPKIDPKYKADGHFNRFGNLLIGNYLANQLVPLIPTSSIKGSQ